MGKLCVLFFFDWRTVNENYLDSSAVIFKVIFPVLVANKTRQK